MSCRVVRFETLAVFGLLSLLLSLMTAVASASDWVRYENPEFGFAIAYPAGWPEHVDTSPFPHRLFAVSFGQAVPNLSVWVQSNPDCLELDAFVRNDFRSLPAEAVGIERLAMAGEKAIRATFFAEAGAGCATSQVFIAHGGRVYRILSHCESGSLPYAMRQFSFLDPK